MGHDKGLIQIVHADSLEYLRGQPDNSFDACVCDPPYGLSPDGKSRTWDDIAGERKRGGFMSKEWDSAVPGITFWREVLRVLKPGGHLVAFGGTRTYHRMACAIEDAGFEVRDQIQWLYGQGFPKSLDVSKAIDKAAGARRPQIGIASDFSRDGSKRKTDGSHDVPHENQGGHGFGDRWSAPVTAPATYDAKKWNGWGTALKPSNEPICLARKPILEPTVAANVMRWGTGAINIEATRIPCDDKTAFPVGDYGDRGLYGASGDRSDDQSPDARWPGNLVIDEEAGALMDQQTGTLKSGSRQAGVRKGMGFNGAAGDGGPAIEASEGGASRFFYCAKTSTHERNAGLSGLEAKFSPTMGNGIGGKEHDPETATKKQNIHPTVKPIALMRWLVRLVTPPGGRVLEPFLGSGTTAVACKLEGVACTGIEREVEYITIARARVDAATEALYDTTTPKEVVSPDQFDLFGGQD